MIETNPNVKVYLALKLVCSSPVANYAHVNQVAQLEVDLLDVVRCSNSAPLVQPTAKRRGLMLHGKSEDVLVAVAAHSRRRSSSMARARHAGW